MSFSFLISLLITFPRLLRLSLSISSAHDLPHFFLYLDIVCRPFYYPSYVGPFHTLSFVSADFRILILTFQFSFTSHCPVIFILFPSFNLSFEHFVVYILPSVLLFHFSCLFLFPILCSCSTYLLFYPFAFIGFPFMLFSYLSSHVAIVFLDLIYL